MVIRTALIVCILLVATVLRQSVADAQSGEPSVALTGGTVIDVLTGAALPDRTVVIAGERITAIGSAGTTEIPPGARIIDARGRWVIPGLMDLHAHIAGRDQLPLGLFLANGVTTIRDPGGNVTELRLIRDELRSGRRAGPRLFFAGQLLDGNPPVWPAMSFMVETPGEVSSAVNFLLEQGADYIKVYNHVTEPALAAIIRAARARGTFAIGHVPRTMTMSRAVELGLTRLEHIRITGRELLSADEATKIDMLPLGRRETLLWDRFDLESPKMKALIALLGERQVFLDPTLTIDEGLFVHSVRTAQATHPNNQYLPERLRKRWSSQPEPAIFEIPADLRQKAAAGFAKRLEFVRMCQRAGVQIVAGTDGAGLGTLLPGFGLHHELELLARAGLSPLEVLRASTITAARALGKEADLGTIEAGKLADLVVLTADPTRDIRNVRKIEVVVAGGRVYHPGEFLKEGTSSSGAVHQSDPEPVR